MSGHPAVPGSPSAHRLMAAIDATWPAADIREMGGWTLRNGAGGGKRVSATRGHGIIAEAEAAMAAMKQPSLFSLTEGDEALDADLARRGYGVVDPVALYTIPVAALADGRDETARVIRCTTPVRRVEEIWDEGGIGPARRAIMERPAGPRQILMARAGDRPAGCAFAACDRDVAMIHAIEVLAEQRRQGVGERLLRGAASFAAEQGATWLALAVTEANEPANALYAKLGMSRVAQYHYRLKPD